MSLGEWEPFVREVAHGDYERAQAIQYWPVCEVLIAYLELIKDHLREGYRHAQLLYQIRVSFGGGKQTPPELPQLLREKPEP